MLPKKTLFAAALALSCSVLSAQQKRTTSKTDRSSKYLPINIAGANRVSAADQELIDQSNASDKGGATDRRIYKTPLAITADGKTAYFSKVVYVKPLYGVFSNKQKLHKIYKARNINGKWRNISEVELCPKHASAMHPTISPDGKRLFFASDMPGTYGKFDIYVADLKSNGKFGVSKNLGDKVNTKKDDLYPSLSKGTSTTLTFASEGHDGFGGLDLFVVEVEKKKVSLSSNLGSSINSKSDEFAVLLDGNNRGYVMSNRGKSKHTVNAIAFSNDKAKNTKLDSNGKYKNVPTFNANNRTNYTSTAFEDDE